MKPDEDENNGSTTLRDRHVAQTRQQILDVAMRLLAQGAPHGFSHEAIAAAASMGARTVYRHFPDRAHLLQALWLQTREQTNTKFPEHHDQVASLARTAFESFDKNEPLIRALLSSPAGTEVRDRGGAEGRAAFAQTLAPFLDALAPAERNQIIAVFLAVYSAPFWQLLRDRGHLTGPQARNAVAWTLDVLLNHLQHNRRKNERPRKRTRSR